MDMTPFARFMRSRKGQVGGMADRALNAIIGIVIIAAVLGGTIALVLDSFTNISNTGIALGVLFATVLPLLFAVAIFRALRGTMKL
jgi:hypothetical protein